MIQSNDPDLITNSKSQNIILTKSAGDFQRADIPTPSFKIADSIKSKYIIKKLGTSTIQKNWTSISKIRKLSFKSIDAALNYSSTKAFLFAGDKYTTYYKNSNYTGTAYKISRYWPGVTFNKIDAAFRSGYSNDKIYFFSGNRYIRYDVSSKKADRGYPKRISAGFPGASKLASISATLRGDGNWVYFLGKDSKGKSSYTVYNLNTGKTPSNYPRKLEWSGLDNKDISAALYLDNKKYMLFFYT
jgi:hypothetical protein